MALTLRAAIDDSQTYIELLGDDALRSGNILAVGDEWLDVGAVSTGVPRYGEAAYRQVTVRRGAYGTTRAAHDADAAATVTTVGSGSGEVSAPLSLTGTDPAEPIVSLQAAPEQEGSADADLFVVKNPDGDAVLRLTAQEVVKLANRGGSGAFYIYDESEGINGPLVVEIGPKGPVALASTNPAIDQLNVAPLVTLDAGKFVAQFWGSTSGVLILRTGHFGIRATAAPADGDIGNGRLFFWYDPTNGSPKLMLKGKQADGTIVTGEVALT